MATLRQANEDEACDKVVELINRDIAPQAIWDALFIGAGELLVRQPGIVALHVDHHLQRAALRLGHHGQRRHAADAALAKCGLRLDVSPGDRQPRRQAEGFRSRSVAAGGPGRGRPQAGRGDFCRRQWRQDEGGRQGAFVLAGQSRANRTGRRRAAVDLYQGARTCTTTSTARRCSRIITICRRPGVPSIWRRACSSSKAPADKTTSSSSEQERRWPKVFALASRERFRCLHPRLKWPCRARDHACIPLVSPDPWPLIPAPWSFQISSNGNSGLRRLW